MFLKSKDIVKHINPQVAFNFLSGERLKILEEPKAGSFVYVNPQNEEIIKIENQKNISVWSWKYFKVIKI